MNHWRCRLAMMLVTVSTIVAGCQPESPGSAGQPDGPPTIILVCADDLDWEMLAHDWDQTGVAPHPDTPSVKFPALKAMADEGIVFSNFHITTPVCGPSRAALLSGQYAHRNQVRVNQPSSWISNGFPGGALPFDPTHSLAPWMQQSGYQTCFVGKYLHHDFAPRKELGETWASIRPPGWDYFQPALGARYFDYWILDNATSQPRHPATGYRTDAETDEIIQLLDCWKPQQGPQFICWMPVAPHVDAHEAGMVADRHRDWYGDSLPPNLDEHLSARPESLPAELQTLPRPDNALREHVIELWQDRLRATRALDEGLARIRQTLKRQGRLENTIIVFSSDHGFRMGQHGHVGKRLPYDRITRVPTIVCGGGIAPGRSHQLLANIDIAPTLVELAGGDIPKFPDQVDGQSFARLLKDPDAPLDPPRDGVLLEHWESEINGSITLPAMWSAWRGPDDIYTEWATGGREYYDLARDPEQMHNRYSGLPPERRQQLAGKLRTSRHQHAAPMISDMLATHDTPLANPVSTNFIPLVLSGFVEAGAGVRRVELQLHCAETGEYWDGQRWQTVPARLPAQLDNPEGQMTRWSWALDNSGNLTEQVDVPERTVQVSLWAIDGAGQQSVRAMETPLTVRFDDPESWIDTPADLTGGCHPIVVTGRARDNTRVARVTLVVNDKDTGQYWNGNTWVTDYVALEAELQPGDAENEVRWSCQLTVRSGNRIFVGARAIDEHNNYDRTLPFFEFPPVSEERP